jgi:hypothetical protein
MMSVACRSKYLSGGRKGRAKTLALWNWPTSTLVHHASPATLLHYVRHVWSHNSTLLYTCSSGPPIAVFEVSVAHSTPLDFTARFDRYRGSTAVRLSFRRAPDECSISPPKLRREVVGCRVLMTSAVSKGDLIDSYLRGLHYMDI